MHANVLAVHNVYFVQYVFLLTEQAETHIEICVLIYHLTNIFSQVVPLEGKRDFWGKGDFQTLNVQFPGYFDRFWVFEN